MPDRFLQDMASIDGSVPYSVLDQVSKTFSIVAQFMLIVVYAPLVFLVLPVMVIIYVGIFRTVRIAARDTRRIQSVARSPVYEFFSDVIDGRDTIQCTGAEDRFERGNHDRVEKMAQGTFGNEAVMKWAQALTTQSSCMLYFAAGVVSVILISQNKMSLGAFGLVLMYAASLQRAMMDYLMGLTNVETNFVSVERIADILRMPVETDDRLLATTEQPAGWPVAGEVRLDRVAMRYTIGRPEVLKGISLTIPAGSKVAVIGRYCRDSRNTLFLSNRERMQDGVWQELDGISFVVIVSDWSRIDLDRWCSLGTFAFGCRSACRPRYSARPCAVWWLRQVQSRAW